VQGEADAPVNRWLGDLEESLVAEDEEEDIPTQLSSQVSQRHVFAQPSQATYVPAQLSQPPLFAHPVGPRQFNLPQIAQPIARQFPLRPPSRNQQPAAKRARRGPNFTLVEINHMLDIIEKHLPLGGEMWEQVAAEHNMVYGENERDSTSLKKKFQDLYKKKIPTGDSRIPPEVKHAKLIQQQILGANAAADVSEENGGYQGVVQSIARARNAAVESDSELSNRLDGTRPMSSRRRASPANPGDMMQMLMMQQMQQMQQYELERKERQEERKESRDMWMGLIAAGIGLAGGNTNDITKRLFGKKKRKKRTTESDDDNSSNGNSSSD
jgi:hypothetical protein